MLPRAVATFLLSVVLAGCDDPGPRFPTHEETRRAEYENFPGVVVEGTLAGGGPEVFIDAEARNEGRITYKVSAICIPPWTEAMRGRLGTVYPHGQEVYCHAFGLRDFRPGESIAHHVAWNGTLWDLQKERYVPAGAGTYEWTLLFEAYGQCVGNDCEVHDWIKLHFTVRVK